MPPEDEITRSLSCPACGGTIAVRAVGYTVTLACEHCGSLIDVAHPDAKIITRYNETQARLAIPLGTRGVLRGVEWEVIGWLERSDGWASWQEFLLFNPYEGYRWLIEQNGHWSLGTMLTKAPSYDSGGFVAGGRLHEPFYAGSTAKVTRIAGEFYWRVKIGEEVRATDYVRSGFMLSLEANEREKSWTLNELLNAQEITTAFDVPRPPRWLPGMTPLAHQPSPFARRFTSWLPLGVVALIALLVLSLLFGQTTAPQTFSFEAVPDGPAVSQTFGPITIPSGRRAMTIDVSTSDINQGWVDIDIAFVNRATQESYEAYALNEHYEGADADGPWSEGSRIQTLKVASLTAGTYDLVVDATAHHWGNTGAFGNWNAISGSMDAPSFSAVNVNLTVSRGAQFASNFWLAVLFVLLPPLLLLCLHIMFENARLAQRDGEEVGSFEWMKGLVP